MEIDLESQTWKAAFQLLGARLQAVVEEGIGSFQRPPGLDSPTRIHQADIGRQALTALRDALAARHQPGSDISNLTYVGMRSRLRRHLMRHLQWHLMEAGVAEDRVGEDYLATDLGL